MINNRKQRKTTEAHWRVVEGKSLGCKLVADAVIVKKDGYAAIALSAMNGKHPFAVVLSADDAAELVTTLIKLGASRIIHA